MSSSSALNSLASSSGLTSTNSALDLSNILTSLSGSSTTGIDVNAAVSSAIYADEAPERVWQADQVTLSNQTSALNQLQTATEAVYNDLQSLNTLTGPFSAMNVASADPNYVSATASDGTAAGTHTVVVNNLASTASWYSDLEASPTTALPDSSLTITTAGGATATFATGTGNAGDNLNDLATAINGASLGVTATVVTDSTGSRLSIVSNNTGAASDFSITSPNFTGTSWTAPSIASGATLGANSMVISSGSASVTVATTSGETYSQLADAINSAVSAYNTTATANGQATLNVTAAAGSDSSGDTNLSLTSSDGTTPFSVNEPAFSFTQANAATNASATVDGVPVQSATNTLTGTIPGLTIDLLGATQGTPVTLTVASNSSAIAQAVNQFVSDYNSAIGLVNAQFTVSSSTDSSGNTTASEGVLSGDSTITNLQNAMEQALNYTVPSGSTTSVSSLASLGITMNNDGTLSVDSTTLDNVIQNDPTDVQNFFQGQALNGFASSFSSVLNNFTAPANGAFQVDLQSISSQNNALTQEISDFQPYIQSQQTILTADYSKAESSLQTMNQTMSQLNALLGFNTSSNSNGG